MLRRMSLPEPTHPTSTPPYSTISTLLLILPCCSASSKKITKKRNRHPNTADLNTSVSSSKRDAAYHGRYRPTTQNTSNQKRYTKAIGSQKSGSIGTSIHPL